MSNTLYNKLKFLALIILPGLATLYFLLAGILDLPESKTVIGLIVAVDLFLGVILYSAASKYNDNREDAKRGRIQGGVIRITDVGDRQVFSLELEGDPVVFEDKKEVIFKVNLNKTGDV